MTPPLRSKIIVPRIKESEFDYIKGSKCDHRKFAGQYEGIGRGNRKDFLEACYRAAGTKKRLCMDMTCPNTNQRAVFYDLYPAKKFGNVPFQLIPSEYGYKTGIELVQIVSKLERNGVCVTQIVNWHRPGEYNDHENVDGKPGSYHKVQGGYKAIDIKFCSSEDLSDAIKKVHRWDGGSWKGGMGVYWGSNKLHIDRRNGRARW